MNNHILETIPGNVNTNINSDPWEFRRMREIDDRRLYLYGEIVSVSGDCFDYADSSIASMLVEEILNINRLDDGKPIEEREPIRLYINSPGGEPTEGFALIAAIELSKTPVYTINIGQWSSMAFLVGIAGHKRFSLPYVSFLMHDGSIFLYGSANKVKDRVAFEDRIEEKIVKPYVLKHSKMSSDTYDKLDRKEFYMLPEEALVYGFIDEIIDNLEAIF